MTTAAELFIYRDRREASDAGFRGQRHPGMPYAMAWWPGAGMSSIMQGRFQRVIVDSSIYDSRFLDERRRDELRHAAHQLRCSAEVFGAQFVWVGPRLP